MPRIIPEPIQIRCEQCKTLIEFEVSDYPKRYIGCGRRQGFTCAACGEFIPYFLQALPLAWKKLIEEEERSLCDDD